MVSEHDLNQLLMRTEPAMADTVRALAALIGEVAPTLEGMIRIGWGSINYRHATAGFVCAVFPMQDHVSLVFEHGRQLNSPMLQGDGAQVRFIRIEPGALPDRDALAILIAEAIALRA
ncbi:DUF1801 domain-containing protein [Devosia sp.]|uniref:DUF1801 domain-containing protein n=1 Tax=Devosia sp. TaxID=1871048 RepID=UPI003A9495F8